MDDIKMRQQFLNATQSLKDGTIASKTFPNQYLPAILIFIVAYGMMLAMGKSAAAQSVAPPPGFSPGQDGGDDALPSPPAEPRIYTGHGDYTNPYSNSNFGYDANPFADPAQPTVAPRRIRTFRTPPATVLIPDEEPAMPRIWFRGEALLWWQKASPISVPIVTLGNPSDPVPGAVGPQNNSTILMGNQNVGLPGSGGGRFTLGFTFDPEQTWGMEGTYFYLANSSVTQSVFSDGSVGSPQLFVPYYDPTGPGESASSISSPGNYAGIASVTVQSMLQGFDLNLLHNQLNSGGFRVDLLGGFRYLSLREDLNFQTQSPTVGDPYSFYNTFDEFTTNNNFYGAQVGVRGSYDPNRFLFVNATTKLAVGDMFENVNVNGGTFTNNGGGFSSANGGYLTGPSNIGSMTRNQLAVIPEMNLNFGIRLRPWASIIVGYTFLYVSSVARPGEQIDHVINPQNSPAISGNFSGNTAIPANPSLSVSNTSYWAQGLNIALEFRF
jgi:hypothetical protein